MYGGEGKKHSTRINPGLSVENCAGSQSSSAKVNRPPAQRNSGQLTHGENSGRETVLWASVQCLKFWDYTSHLENSKVRVLYSQIISKEEQQKQKHKKMSLVLFFLKLWSILKLFLYVNSDYLPVARHCPSETTSPSRLYTRSSGYFSSGRPYPDPWLNAVAA